MKTTAILVSRNDNYGGNLHKRTAMSLCSLIENHDEVIFVDWKVKNDDSVIGNIKNKIPNVKKLKHIKVTKDFLQQRYPQISNYTIIESIGRNVAIRRSDTDYIISTNIDIIATPLNKESLHENIFYTVPRRDVGEDFHLSFSNFEDLYQILLKNKDEYIQKEKSNSVEDKWSLINCCGDYQIGHKDVWFKMKGFEESILFGCGIDTNVMKKASFYSEIKILDHYIFHLNHGKVGNRDLDESVPPMSYQPHIIRDFKNTSNTDDWGMANENLPIEII